MKAGKEQSKTILTLEDVTFGYGGNPVLDGVSLAFRPGEFVAVVGPNGCGKSTLLKVMAGLLVPGHGSVMLEGRYISAFSRKKLAQRMAMLAQSNEAPAGMVVSDLVGMGRFAHEGWLSRGTPKDQTHIDTAMQTMAVSDLAARRVGELSGGQLQRARMAMALAQDANILLLDEPTNHLDLKHQYALLETAREQAATGRAVIAVLHDLIHASLYADRIILMDGGKVVADGSASEVLTCANVADVYGIRTAAQSFGRAIVHLPESAVE